MSTHTGNAVRGRSRAAQREARALAARHQIGYQQALSQLQEVPLTGQPLGDDHDWYEVVYPGEPVILPLTDELEQEIEIALADKETESLFAQSGLWKPIDWREPRAEYEQRLKEIQRRIRLLRNRGITSVRGTCEKETLATAELADGQLIALGASKMAMGMSCPELFQDTLELPERLIGLRPFPFNNLQRSTLSLISFDQLEDHCRLHAIPLPGRSTPLTLQLLPPLQDLAEALEQASTITPELLQAALTAGIQLTVRARSGYPAPDYAVQMINDAGGTGWSWSEWPASSIHAAERGARVEIYGHRNRRHTAKVSAQTFEEAVLTALRLAASGHCSAAEATERLFVGKGKSELIPVTARVLLGEIDRFLTGRTESPFRTDPALWEPLQRWLYPKDRRLSRMELTPEAERQLAARLGLEAASAGASEPQWKQFLEQVLPLLEHFATGAECSSSERAKAWRARNSVYPHARGGDAEEDAMSAVQYALDICASAGRYRRHDLAPERAFGYLGEAFLTAAFLRGGKTELRRAALRTRDLVLEAAKVSV